LCHSRRRRSCRRSRRSNSWRNGRLRYNRRSHSRSGRRSRWRSRRPHPRGLRRRVSGFLFGLGLFLGSRFRVSDALQVLPNLLRDVFWNRAGVRLLFRDAIARQEVDDRLRFDLEFASQFVDSYLISFRHASYRPQLRRDLLLAYSCNLSLVLVGIFFSASFMPRFAVCLAAGFARLSCRRA
jgi:hypothetical protein